MPLDTSHRTSQEEALDDFELAGTDLRDALDKIATINRWLGGNKITLDGIHYLRQHCSSTTSLTIIDIGCGNGDMCRAIADYANTIAHAQLCSKNYPTISYAVQNVFDESFASLQYDVAVCTLTLHHFSDADILSLMALLANKARLGIVINDLHRSALAYRLFQLICFIFQLNDLSREDGLISILRGFKKNELEYYSRQLQLANYRIRWKWAFRYQWIIKNLCQ